MSKFRQHLQHVPLLVLLLVALALFAACSESHRSPTEPEAPVTMSSSTAASQVTAEANGHGHGNGGNGGGNGGGGHGQGGDLAVRMQPDVWNTNWSHSQGTVSALITGGDLDQISLSSIVLVGHTGGTAVHPTRTQRVGNSVRAFFRQSDALASLDHPHSGDTVQVEIDFTQGGTAKHLTDSVRIVGPGGGGGGGDDDGEADLEVQIQPDSWNTNWPHSSGTVSALIEGDGLADIDLHSIKLVGTDAAAAPLAATRATRSGNHVRAFFPMAGAFATLDHPVPGHSYEITIQLSVGGTATELTDRIRVVGPNR